jgi:DNA polymerase elongation subunit (family B)
MSKDLLLDVDYVTVDETAQVRLFLRGATLYDPNFSPYFYVLSSSEDVSEKLSDFGTVERVKMALLGNTVWVYKLFVSHPSARTCWCRRHL